MTALVPLPVAVPLFLAAILLALAHYLPRRVADILATLTGLAVAAICVVLMLYAGRHGTLTYWFGGWMPRPGVVLGIGFGVDMASAGLAGFIGFLFAATFIFAWGYFDEVHAHFHVLMLLFMAAMIGFCFTKDLFNLFVWFEVMSVAAFALTAYQLEMPSLAGALNFTVTNSLASFMMLAGVGLIYARASSLDFQTVGLAVARAGSDPVIIGAFCLLSAALMIKAAILPFHFWLSDAHAVAPSPVSVIFSGAMVGLGLFGLAKLGFIIFAASAEAHALFHGLFTGLGIATAIIGGLMAWNQRHLKRMLAFSTIAHLGIMLCGLAALSATGLAGLFVYLIGHGLVKGTLFMLAGVLLATRASVDELDLYGCGKGIAPAGIAMALAGLLLGGMPWGVLDSGTRLVTAARSSSAGIWIAAAILFGTALTGAAVLRAAGRIFLALGPEPDPEEAESPSDQEQEKADRPLWLMMIPCVVLLALALLPGEVAERLGAKAASLFAPQLSAASSGTNTLSAILPWTSVALTIGIASFALFCDRLPQSLTAASAALTRPVLHGLGIVHNGLVGDYVLWIALGLSAFSLALALG